MKTNATVTRLNEQALSADNMQNENEHGTLKPGDECAGRIIEKLMASWTRRPDDGLKQGSR